MLPLEIPIYMMSRIFSKHLLSIFIIGIYVIFAIKTDAQSPSLAEQVFQKYQTILLSEDVQAVLPAVLVELKKPDTQALLRPSMIKLVAENPDLLKVIAPEIDDRFIRLLKEDPEVNTFINDPDLHVLLQNPTEIDELAVLLDLQTVAIVGIVPVSIESPNVGEQFAIAVVTTNAQNVRGYRLSVQFDPEALRYVSSQQGTYLSGDVFVAPATIKADRVSFVVTAPMEAASTQGVLLTITFEVVATKASMLSLSDVMLVNGEGRVLPVKTEDGEVVEPIPMDTEDGEVVQPTPAETVETEETEIAERLTPVWDVNEDGFVNILDLVLVSSNFGEEGSVPADVNGDNVVNILDLTLVASHLGEYYEQP